MRTKKYFIDENSEKYPVISGRYGYYCRRNGFNYSAKQMQKLGFEIQDLTSEQEKESNEKYAAFLRKATAEAYKREMKRNKRCVEICLNSEPLEIGEGNLFYKHVTNISGAMLEAYNGCGDGLAYVKEDKIIAFHYGCIRPENAPEAEAIRVDFSCTQILF